MSELDALLWQSAQRYAQRALDAYLGEEFADFALLAGVALEHLAKSRLAADNPAFLANRDDFSSMLALSRMADSPAQLALHRVRTIGASEAITRVRRVLAGQMDPSLDVRDLLDQRNGEAHVALADPEKVRASLEIFVRVAGELVRDVEEHDEFWEVHYDFVDSVLADAITEDERRARQRIAAAETSSWERYGQLTPAERAAAFDALRVAIELGEDQVGTDCPVCGGPAVATGTLDLDVGIPADARSDEAALAAAKPVVTFIPAEIQCRACRLMLVGEVELAVSKLPTSWTLEVDPAEFADPYYGVANLD
jgi:hypothetical protein